MSDRPEEGATPEASSSAKDKGAQMGWVPVTSVPEEIEATLASGFLENEGIQCVVESRFFTQEPTNLSTLGEFVLYVHEDALERARSLLETRLEIENQTGSRPDLDGLIEEEAEGRSGKGEEE